MPLVSTIDFGKTVEEGRYRWRGELTINLPASDYVDFSHALSNVQLSASMNTDLPDGVRDVAGLEAMTGDITVAGFVSQRDHTFTVADLFNPDNLDSPLAHLTVNDCSINLDLGAFVYGSKDPEMMRFLTGWINGYDVDHVNGVVVFHVVDLDPKWNNEISLPSVVTADPFNAELTSEFTMDQTIRAVLGESTWPAQRPQCVVSVGMRASIWPERGTLAPQSLATPSFRQGVYGTALASMRFLNGNFTSPTYIFETPGTTSVYTEYLFDSISTADSAGGSLISSTLSTVLEWDISPTGVTVDGSAVASGSYAAAIDDSPHWFGILWTFAASGSGTSTVTLYIDGVSHAISSATRTSPGPVIMGAINYCESLNFTLESNPTPRTSFVPAAVLDPSLNPLTVVPEIPAGSKPWDLLQTMAAAECGFIRRVNGQIVFSNRVTLLSQVPARDITSTRSLKQFGTSVPASNASLAVNVPYTPWDFGAATLVYTLPSKTKIPRKGSITWTQPLTDVDGNAILAAQIDTSVTLLPNGHTTTDGGSYYRASADIDGLNPGPAGTLTFTIVQTTSGSVTITVANSASVDQYLTTPASYTDFGAGTTSSGLWLGGLPVTQGDEAIATVTTGDGRNPLDVSSTVYLQDHDTAVELGKFLLAQVCMDIRDFTDLSIIPDFRILVGDLEHLLDPKVSGVNEYVSVWGVSLTADFPAPGEDGGSLDMSLNVRALGPPDSWLGGAIPDRAEVDSTWAYSAA